MRILLTGAAGFVGSYVLRHLMRDEDHDVACLLRSATDLWRIADVDPQPQRITADLDRLTDARKAIEAFRPEALIHLAWTGVGNGTEVATRESTNPA